MSGGSYNYLCRKAAHGLLTEAAGFEDLVDITARLNELGYADVAADAQAVIDAVLAQERALQRLSDVFQAVEWHDSADWGASQVRDAVAAYRESRR